MPTEVIGRSAGFATLVALLMAVLAVPAYTSAKPSWMIGLDLPTLGWPTYDQEGALRSVWGLNLALGLSFRSFTADDGLEPGRFNFYWGWGTSLLFLPTYFEIGAMYPGQMDTDKLLCFSLGVMGIFIIYPLPYVAVSFWL